MKKILFTLLMLAGLVSARAEGSALCVTRTNGQVAYYILSEKPVVTFGETTMLIVTSNVSTEYQRTEVENFTFVDKKAITGIAQIGEGNTVFQYQDNTIRGAGGAIQVYNSQGKLVKQGEGIVSLDNQPQGVYVVKMNQQTIKVIKK